MSDSSQFLLALEFAGTGAHPSSWRRDDSRAEDLFAARYWVDLVGSADRAGVDLAFLPDDFGVASTGREVRGRFEAVGIAARLSAATSRIGLVPTATVTHTEPFHLAKAIQTIDHTTAGRAVWEVAVTENYDVTKLFGRKEAQQDTASLWAEAHEAAEVASRLWDSWEDDAEIRDVATGRFIDRDKLHYIDFAGEYFSVKGPSITPRSPQGQPLVAVTVDGGESFEFAVARADLVRIRAKTVEEAAALAARLRDAVGSRPVRVLLDVDVLLAADEDAAVAALAALDGWTERTYTPDTVFYRGGPDGLRELIESLQGVDGVTLRPLALASTVHRLVDDVLPALRPTAAPTPGTLRERLGLALPANRYATSN
jgi:alkanesulfonate monooxygenase SsuD/methylene tetrahydromethanopterin reductase-like flavin-dependent oxidoreductase (luciferase family)